MLLVVCCFGDCRASLCVVCCSLFASGCAFVVDRCLLLAACCSLFVVVLCVLFAVRC